MLSQLEQACKNYSTESSSGLIEFDSNWLCIYVIALTFLLDQAILRKFAVKKAIGRNLNVAVRAYTFLTCLYFENSPVKKRNLIFFFQK